MKRLPAFIAGIVIFLGLAAGAYFWATGLIDSIYAYRSPLKDAPPQPGPALGQPATRRVVFVLIDALRYDTSLKAETMPVLTQLRRQGASARMNSRTPSFSEPGYSTLLTGAWPDISDGPAVNLDYADIPTWTQDNLFSAAARSGLKTAVSGYYWFEKLIPQGAVSESFYTPGEDRAADRQVVDAALPWLEATKDQLVLIHIDQVDYAGHHEGGPRDPRWDQAAKRADDLLGEVLAKLDLQNDTLLVASDHGQIDAGGHGGPEPINLVEPFVLAGAGVRPGTYGDIQMVDVAPTLAALLGTNIPAASQGQALVQLLSLPPSTSNALPAAQVAQQSQLLTAYARAIGQAIALPAATDVAAYQAALDAAHAARLGRERLPRAILAVILFLLPLVLILRHRRSTVLWFAGGALIYIILFNLRYAVLDGKTYSLTSVTGASDLIVYCAVTAAIALAAAWLFASMGLGLFRQAPLPAARGVQGLAAMTYSLSSVTGASDLIVYCAVTAAIALAVAWLFASLGLGLFRQAPLPAARGVQGLAAMTIYLLLVPVLVHFSLNGLTPTWTLPEFWSAFVALLSLVQILIVAVIGLVLMGVTAAIAAIRKNI